VPRDAKGDVNFDAPTPRTPDGKPDLSGIWMRAESGPPRGNRGRAGEAGRAGGAGRTSRGARERSGTRDARDRERRPNTANAPLAACR
jgi:hypothetical protein